MSDKSPWTDYRKLQRRALLLAGCGFLVLGVLVLLPREWVPRHAGPLLVVGAGYAIVLAVLSIRLSFWPCPRCGKPFFIRFGFFPSYSGRCARCRLPYGG